ncbi:MAG TPA: ABC transporter permease [Tenuifilaceae bacterium]|nr:ABC transporter permease [Tenuifilaceae bacterium]
MVKSYLITAVRSILRNKLTSTINILGLGLGMGVFILIMIFINQELQIDKFINDKNRIFRVECGDWAIMGPGFFEKAAELCGEIETSAMIQPNAVSNDAVKKEGNSVRANSYIAANSNFIRFFGFDVLVGDSQNPLSQPNSLVLTLSEAKRVFGNTNPVGKTLTFNDSIEMLVTAVIKNPDNFHFPFNAVFSFEQYVAISGRENYRNQLLNNMNNPTYLKLRFASDKEKVEQKLSDEIFKLINSNTRFEMTLRPVRNIYFQGLLPFEGAVRHGNLKFIRVMVVVAFLILILACINFINLSTARASTRAKEISVRKVCGGNRKKIVAQFLGESVLVAFLSLLVAVVFVELFSPVFSNLIERTVVPSFFSSKWLIVSMIMGSLVIGLVSGFYPALFLSSFNPVRVLKGELLKGSGKGLFRKVLIVFQFSVSVGLIIVTIIIYSQIKYFTGYDVGFDKSQVITIQQPRKVRFEYPTLKEKVQKVSGVLGISRSNSKPGEISWQESCYDSLGQHHNFTFQPVDPDYINVLGLELVEGRNFDWDRPSDVKETVIINETFAKMLGINQITGEKLNSKYIDSYIIGIVKDYNFNSLHSPIGPLALNFRNSAYNTFNIRIDGNNIHSVIEGLRGIWEEYSVETPFEYSFLNESFENLYRSEIRMAKLFGHFSFIAIFIACMGLFGLAAFILQSKIKEMGIRKVLGSSTLNIVGLMGKEFTILVLISNAIAWPIAWYSMSRWLEGFPYKTNISLVFFLFALLLSLLIAFVTVSYHSWQTARANPIDSLKYE